jgi:hypothetical protein
MFVQADLELALPFDVAMGALERAVADGGLVAESRRAVGEGLAFSVPVGPHGGAGLSMQVVVRLLAGHLLDGDYLVGLRWEVPGLSRRLFPALDANLALSAAGPGSSRLSVIGSYEPPLGKVGVALDRAGMSRVASATMRSFLREVASQVGALAGDQADRPGPLGPPAGPTHAG